MEKTQPKTRVRIGNCTTTVWENEVEIKGQKVKKLSFNIQKSYKDGEEWKNTSSLNLADLPKAILSLEKAFEYAYSGNQEDDGEN